MSPVLASAHKKLSATYQLSYMKHAPIGPTMAVADVKADGTVHIYAHNQNPQALRGEIAMMLRTTPDHVIVHAYPGPGHYGGQTAETRALKMKRCFCRKRSASRSACSGCAPMICSGPRNRRFPSPTFRLRLDEKGKIAAYQIDHYMPAMQDDRPVGAVLAGLPTMSAPQVHSDGATSTVNGIEDPWVYAAVPNLARMATARSRWDKKLRLSPSVSAITACARRGSFSRTIRANWRSARQQRSRARTPSSSASTTPAKSGPSEC
jgi:nicotinate dehydrogenase subunit B